jgi:hypothetical protein
LPIGAHGKEGVDGSSPSEGFAKSLQISSFVLCSGDADKERRQPYAAGVRSPANALA